MVAFTFTAFAQMKVLFRAYTGEDAAGVWPLLLGGLAACTACVATQPIDVVKTRLMTQVRLRV